jgi:diamine N-acetyltransferase
MIAEGHRGQGYGRAAMLRILDEARERGFSRVGLSTEPGNVKAIRLYESLGFRATGEIDHGEAVYLRVGEEA